MKIFWLGQAGLYFETDEGFKVMVDPYFSDSCETLSPNNKRRLPVDPKVFDLKPDIMVFTHNHLDHYDPETVAHYLKEDSDIIVLAPNSVWSEVRKFGGNNNYVQFDPHTEWSQYGLLFKAVKAAHSDPDAIGFIMEDGKRVYYITGDTLYNTDVIADLPHRIDIVFLPINGKGNNMNIEDAMRFVWAIGARKAVPLHYGMFDDISPEKFDVPGRIIPKPYEEF